MAADVLSVIGIGLLAGVLYGAAADPAATGIEPAESKPERVSDESRGTVRVSGESGEVTVTYRRAGVDDVGCVLYRILRERDGRPLPVRAGLLWRRMTGEWTRGRPKDCVRVEIEHRPTP